MVERLIRDFRSVISSSFYPLMIQSSRAASYAPIQQGSDDILSEIVFFLKEQFWDIGRVIQEFPTFRIAKRCGTTVPVWNLIQLNTQFFTHGFNSQFPAC